MSNYRINAAREVLSGMMEGVNYAYAHGREPSESLMLDIREREQEIEDMERSHNEQHGGRQCHCNAHIHGGDCMCFE